MKLRHRSRCILRLLGLWAISGLVVAGALALLSSEQTLDDRPMRLLVREAWISDPHQLEARELIRRKGSKVVPALVEIMAPRTSLANCLARQIKWWPYGALPLRLREWAETEDQQQRSREIDREWAVVLCGSLNNNAAAARPALIRACQDPNSAVRREAAKALLRTGVPPAQALPVLSRLLLYDGSPDVRRWAAFYMGLLGEEAHRTLPALRQAANDPNEWLASRAREALRKVEEADALQTRRRDAVSFTQ
jgi:hypothetical protein